MRWEPWPDENAASLLPPSELGFVHPSKEAYSDMGESKGGRAVLGVVIGLVLGIFLGEHRVAEIAEEHGEIVPTGLNPLPYMHHVRFWLVLIICTLVFTFIVGKIGRQPSQSDM